MTPQQFRYLRQVATACFLGILASCACSNPVYLGTHPRMIFVLHCLSPLLLAIGCVYFLLASLRKE